MIDETGVAPATGGVTPAIAAMSIMSSVAGNAAIITPPTEVTDVAPATVKKSFATPVSVNPVLAVRVIVAVYCVPPWKVV